MTVLGIGVDVVHLPRIASLLHRRGGQRFANRVLSDAELCQWNDVVKHDNAEQARFLAVRFSVKEAAYKALYPTSRPTWKELSYHGVDRIAKQKPGLEYTPRITGEPVKLHVSVSHDGDYVFTTVLAEGMTAPT